MSGVVAFLHSRLFFRVQFFIHLFFVLIFGIGVSYSVVVALLTGNPHVRSAWIWGWKMIMDTMMVLRWNPDPSSDCLKNKINM